MHEWALAEGVIQTASGVALEEGITEITEIVVQIGELQQIEQDIFEFALNEIMKSQDEKLKDVKIKIETIKSTLKCKNCEHTWSFSDMRKKLDDDEGEAIHFIPEVAFVHTRCPKCGSPDFEITTGRGVSIAQIKGEK